MTWRAMGGGPWVRVARPTFDDMNGVAAGSLAQVLLPACGRAAAGAGGVRPVRHCSPRHRIPFDSRHEGSNCVG